MCGSCLRDLRHVTGSDTITRSDVSHVTGSDVTGLSFDLRLLNIPIASFSFPYKGTFCTTIVRKKRGENDVTPCDVTSGHVTNVTSGYGVTSGHVT
jgi:hypothetical protein